MPPSRRKGRAYTVYRDIDPIDASKWLTDLILQGSSPRSDAPMADAPVDLPELTDMMRLIPNDDLSWDEWTALALALFAASDGQAFDLFNNISKKSKKHDYNATVNRWNEIKGSPPSRTGVGKLRKIARSNGWRPKLRPAVPTHDADLLDVETARAETEHRIGEFIKTNTGPTATGDVWLDFAAYIEKNFGDPLIWAMSIDTGVGKTQYVIKAVAEAIHVKLLSRVMFAVPRHKLGDRIQRQFEASGISAKVFRGRTAADPEKTEKQMCLNMDAVELAKQYHADIGRTCCKHKKMKCRFFDRCGYQRQMQGNPPQVWIAASDMLFHDQEVFGKPELVVIDESIMRKGLYGVEATDQRAVALDSLLGPASKMNDKFGQRTLNRNWLGETLNKQTEDGGVMRELFGNTLDVMSCSRCIRNEWECMPELELRPGMSAAEISRHASDHKLIYARTRSLNVIKIWEALRDLAANPEIEVSGRLILDQDKGRRVIKCRGVRAIVKRYQVPTLMLDATLPDIAILQVHHPLVKIVANIKVAMPPHVHVRQILNTPTSSTKLDENNSKKSPTKHLDEIVRYIWQRWFETGRQKSLVVCQKHVEDYFRGKLPHNIHIEHFNDIAGLDDYKDVRLQILVGRTAPAAMEIYAAALSGAQPVALTPNAKNFVWFDQAKRGIRLIDGSGVETTCDQHPDPMVEGVRWQIHEGELIQALGRARGVNRTAETPLDVDLLFDSCLPVAVNSVALWERPSLLIATAKDGVMLTSPGDMVRVWPQLWPNTRAADRTLAAAIPKLPGFEPVSYQLKGAKMKPRFGYFDLTAVRRPMVWLEEQLGALQPSLRKMSR